MTDTDRELYAAEVERHVLALRETLVRFDENLKAHHLMESVPYWIEDRPQIKRAKAEQREMVLHAIDSGAYEAYYRNNPHELPFEKMYGLTPENAHEHLFRVQFLRDGLARQAKELKRKPSVLDCTANDGWMLVNLARAGFEDTEGCELNEGAVSRALNVRKVEVTRCDFHDYDGKRADAVVLFETLEHLPDPQASLRRVCEFVAPGGRLYISSPDGAVKQGNLPNWDLVERKGHLHAWTVDQFTAMLEEVGEVVALEVGPDRVAVAEVRPG